MTTAVPRILLVEDDDRIREELARVLGSEGYSVDACSSLTLARHAVERTKPAVVVLDLGLPDGDGLELCRELRARGDSTPIIVLTARDGPEERVIGLDSGADDYVVKPFHPPELAARVRSVLRRSQPEADDDAKVVLSCGLWADPVARSAGKGDRPIDLKRREFELLLFLMRNPGRAWSREQLLERVWEEGFSGDARTVDLHVQRIRAKIEDDKSDPRYIETVWGIGYRWKDEG